MYSKVSNDQNKLNLCAEYSLATSKKRILNQYIYLYIRVLFIYLSIYLYIYIYI